MPPRLLLDTHILIRWLFESRRLSRTQLHVLEAAVRRGEPLAVSAITCFEIALLVDSERLALKAGVAEFLKSVHANPVFRVLPVSFEIAVEGAAMRPLRDPADRLIAATALVHKLRLVTSDERILDSGLVSTVA